MNAVMERPMARKPGRPAKDDGSGDANSRPIRVSNELADKIAWIVRIKKRTDPGFTVAQLIEPLIRGSVNAQYAMIEPQVKRIKSAEQEASDRSNESAE